MIKSRLAVVMAESGKFKIADISRETGIARATLASLYHGRAKGIQFETLDTLCSFFGVGVGDILKYIADGEEIA